MSLMLYRKLIRTSPRPPRIARKEAERGKEAFTGTRRLLKWLRLLQVSIGVRLPLDRQGSGNL